MSKRKSQKDNGISRQQTLFDSRVSEGLFDILLGLKQLMSRQISASGLDRYDIAAGISRMTTRDCSKDMLDKYTSSDLSYEPGVLKLAAFCQVTNCLEPFRYVTGAAPGLHRAMASALAGVALTTSINASPGRAGRSEGKQVVIQQMTVQISNVSDAKDFIQQLQAFVEGHDVT